MIDTDKYEGHTPAPWSFKGPQGLDIENGTHAVVSLYDDPRMRTGGRADMQLIADAPLLLAEVKRLRKGIKHLMILGEEELSYLEGKLEGMELALKIINRRDVDSNSVRWLVREMDSLRNKINEIHGEGE